MRTRTVLGSIFASIGVLVIGWQAGTTVLGATTATTGTPGTTTTGSSGTTTTAVPVESGPADGVYTGAMVNTRFGTVQVQVAIADGAIADVTATKLTDTDSRSVQISNRAAPILREEVLAAQSANVANVSGATYTTHAYLTSLQSALDQARF